MSSGAKGAAPRSRVSIPSSVKKTIDNLKEITGHNHSEDDIYAMLKECSMDPNETAQKLLLLDTFHEVKKKRDRRKENLNKEPAESRWKPSNQSRPNRAGRGNYSRPTSRDAASGINSSAVKENAISHISEKVSKVPLANVQEIKKSEASSVASPITDVSNSPSGITSQSPNSTHDNNVSANGFVNKCNGTGDTSMSKLEGALPFSSPIDSNKKPDALGTRDIQQNEMLNSSTSLTSLPSVSASGSHFSSSNPVLLPSQDFPLHSPMGAIRREVGSHQTSAEVNADHPTEKKSAFAMQQNTPNEFQGVGMTQSLETVQVTSSNIGVSPVSRPSSNYNNQSQAVGPQKAGPGKEWKPKSTNACIGEGASTTASSKVYPLSVGSQRETQQAPLNETTLELQRKLEELHISDTQHVIIPNHLHVPEPGKFGFCFGSFDAGFGLEMSYDGELGSDKSPPLSESSEAIDEPVKELQLSNQTVLVAAENTETKYPDHTQSPPQGPEDLSTSEAGVLSSVTHGESKQEVAPQGHQHPVVHTSSSYNYGYVPPTLSGHLTTFESSEPQARDLPQLPGFIQSFDPASYYGQFYRSGMDSDGSISPLLSAGAANKYNGNAAPVSAQTSQSPQELQGCALVMSPASPVPLVTQAAAVMQSSIAATQQHLPVFRQPTGIHLPHYPPFIPYGAYFPPFYVPSPAIHQYLSHGPFPLQAQGGSLYPIPSETTAKNSSSRHKQGSNTGSSTHIGVPGSYGLYGFPPANYTSSSVNAAFSSTSNEEVKESNILVSGQQTEGSGVGPGQLALTPTQPGQGSFTGIFHPAQAATVATVHPLLQQTQAITFPMDMVGPTAGVYQQQQQQQHPQLNWPSNY